MFEESKTHQKRFVSEFDVALDSLGPLRRLPVRRPLARLRVGVSPVPFLVSSLLFVFLVLFLMLFVFCSLLSAKGC